MVPSTSNNLIKRQSFIYTQLNDQTVLFQTSQFSISHLFALSLNLTQSIGAVEYNGCRGVNYPHSTIWPIDRTLSGATTPGQSGPRSNGNEEVVHIPQSSSITGASPSDCLVSYLGHLLSGGGYSSAKMQSSYSTASTDWAGFQCVFHICESDKS